MIETTTPARHERALMLSLMAAICLTLAHFVHEAWYARESAILAGQTSVINQNFRFAPDAYRVGMPVLVPALQHALRLGSRATVSAGLDFLSGFGALVLLYLLVTEGLEKQSQRFTAAISFLALVQFPFAWVVPYQRPETMPTVFFVALALYAASRRRGDPLWFGVLVVATTLQSLLRTDVPFVFGIALALISIRAAPSGRRGFSLAQGLTIAGIAGGIQWYLQTICFPHLPYPPDTSAFQLLNNLHIHNLGAMLLAVLPCLLPLLLLRRIRTLRPTDLLVLAAAALYLPLWLMVGVAAEVRIFVPFLLALCMVSARTLAGVFAAE